jgi:putative two-component system response regulator
MGAVTRTKRWFRQRTARELIVSVMAVQVIVLAIGAGAIFVQTRSAVARSVEAEVQLGNATVADDLAERMDAVIQQPIRLGGESWRRAQSMIERAGVGFSASACLLDDAGRVICHPDLHDDGEVLGATLGAWTARNAGTGPVEKLSSGEPQTGRVDSRLGGAWYITTRPMPRLGATIVVFTPESAFASAVSEPMIGAWVAFVAAAAGLLALSAIGAMSVSNGYQRRAGRLRRELDLQAERRIAEGLELRNALIFGLAKLADYRDSDTGKHLERIAVYSELLAREIAPNHPEIDETWIMHLKLASSLHDIGKVGIPDVILLKPGKLTPDERRLMEEHVRMGADTLLAIRDRLGPDPLLDMGIEVAFDHHERWDGTGYPRRLSAESISLPGRIVALADFYDALTSKRVYKDARSHDDTYRLIIEGSGAHFDPEIVSAFRCRAMDFDRHRARLQPADVEVPHAEAVLRRLGDAEDRREAA